MNQDQIIDLGTFQTPEFGPDAEATVITARADNQYVNATAMCQAFNKQWGHYASNKATEAYFQALSSDIGIPISELVVTFRGGNEGQRRQQGTWVHPDIAVHLAQWLSPAFAVWVSRKIRELLTKGHVSRRPSVARVPRRRRDKVLAGQQEAFAKQSEAFRDLQSEFWESRRSLETKMHALVNAYLVDVEARTHEKLGKEVSKQTALHIRIDLARELMFRHNDSPRRTEDGRWWIDRAYLAELDAAIDRNDTRTPEERKRSQVDRLLDDLP